MKRTITYSLVTIGLFALTAAVLVFRPVPIVTEKNAIVETGIVKSIFGTENKDVIFVLENNDRTFYINRGQEMGLEISELQRKLIGDEIVIKYPKYWTPLGWNNKIRHISKVEFDDEVLFNELKN